MFKSVVQKSKSVLKLQKCFTNNYYVVTRTLATLKTPESNINQDCKKSKEFEAVFSINCQKDKVKQPTTHEIREDYPFELEEDDFVQMVFKYFIQKNPATGEWNPPRGVFNNAEPTRYGDWEIKGKCLDF